MLDDEGGVSLGANITLYETSSSNTSNAARGGRNIILSYTEAVTSTSHSLLSPRASPPFGSALHTEPSSNAGRGGGGAPMLACFPRASIIASYTEAVASTSQSLLHRRASCIAEPFASQSLLHRRASCIARYHSNCFGRLAH